MSVGVKIYSAEGMLQVSHDHMVPQFIGRFVTSRNGSDIHEGGEQDFVTQSWVAPNINSNGRDMIIYWYIPQACWAYSQSTFLNAVSSGTTIGLLLFVPPNTIIYDPPIAYVFALNRVDRSPDKVALRLWKDNNLIFDSGTLHLSVTELVTNLAYNENTDTNVWASLPSRPAFLFPDKVRSYEVFSGLASNPEGYAQFKQWAGCIKHNGSGSLSGRALLVYNNDQYPASGNGNGRAGYVEDVSHGRTSNFIVPVIDTSLYD